MIKKENKSYVGVIMNFLRMLLIALSITMTMTPTQAFYCTDIFAVRSIERGSTDIANHFAKMNITERIHLLDRETSFLTSKIQPTPRIWERIFSDKAIDRHHKNLKLMNELAVMSEWRKMYLYMLPMMEALHRRGFFFEADEIQLLNRVIKSDRLFDAIELLNQRFKDLPGKSTTEKHFLDAVVSYLTWGPDFSKDQTPIHHWVMFEILTARENPALLANMTKILYQSADMYAREKQQSHWEQLTPTQARIEELWIMQQDPAYKMIEQTSPELVEKVIFEAIDKGLLDYDKRVHSFRIK